MCIYRRITISVKDGFNLSGYNYIFYLYSLQYGNMTRTKQRNVYKRTYIYIKYTDHLVVHFSMTITVRSVLV